MAKELTEEYLLEQIQKCRAQEQQALATANAASGAIQAFEMLRSEFFSKNEEENGEDNVAR